MDPQTAKIATEALAVAGLPTWQVVALVALVASGAAFGAVQVAKGFARGWAKAHGVYQHPWWWQGGLRTIAVLVGLSVGWVLWGSLPGTVSGWPWGAVSGAVSGTFCATVVAFVKRKLGVPDSKERPAPESGAFKVTDAAVSAVTDADDPPA